MRAGPLDARVPGTPDWNLGELGIHIVDVQRWAARIVNVGEPGEPDIPLPAPGEAADALAKSSTDLLKALDGADPDDPCWNFSTAPQTKAFWFRRQALEVSLHRWDAESAVSVDPQHLDPAVAVDVIDEFIRIMLQRVIDREGLNLANITDDVHVHCTDTDGLGLPGEWTFAVADGRLVVSNEHRKAAVAVRAPAPDVALFLYNRVPADNVEILGDSEVLERWSAVFQF